MSQQILIIQNGCLWLLVCGENVLRTSAHVKMVCAWVTSHLYKHRPGQGEDMWKAPSMIQHKLPLKWRWCFLSTQSWLRYRLPWTSHGSYCYLDHGECNLHVVKVLSWLLQITFVFSLETWNVDRFFYWFHIVLFNALNNECLRY